MKNHYYHFLNEEIIEKILKEEKINVLILGNSGSGKTAIVNSLAVDIDSKVLIVNDLDFIEHFDKTKNIEHVNLEKETFDYKKEVYLNIIDSIDSDSFINFDYSNIIIKQLSRNLYFTFESKKDEELYFEIIEKEFKFKLDYIIIIDKKRVNILKK